MNVLLYTAFYLPGFKGGGPIKTVANLVKATEHEINYRIITTDRDLGDVEPYKELHKKRQNKPCQSSVIYCSPSLSGRLRVLKDAVDAKYEVVYFNSFFSIFFSILPLLAAKIAGKKIILGPRGEFSAGALNIKRRKKLLYIRLTRALGVYRNVIFQASSNYEADDIRRTLGEGTDIFVAEDISHLEKPSFIPSKVTNEIKIVFISRISEKKNLKAAINILAKIKVNSTFHIYGPIEDRAYWKTCKELIDSLPSTTIVEYMGELQPHDVVSTIARYDLFFLPTKGENYGHVIAEAFCAGLPVLISNTTPWRDLETKGIGWDFPLDQPELFSQAIERAARLSPEEYQALRENVLNWATERFSQAGAIESNMAMFRYALEKR